MALVWASGSADLAVAADDVLSDEGLQTAVALSLFTDRRAEDDDSLPAEDGDRRGWWADEFAERAGDRIGSRLWLLDRSTQRDDVLREAEEFDREALAWMIEDRVTDRIDVAVTADHGGLVHAITIYRPGGTQVSFRFARPWDAEAGTLPEASGLSEYYLGEGA